MSQLHPISVHLVAAEAAATSKYYFSMDLAAEGALVAYFLCWTIQTLDFPSFMRYSTNSNGTINPPASSAHPSAPVSLEAMTDTADGSGLLDWGAYRPYDGKFAA